MPRPKKPPQSIKLNIASGKGRIDGFLNVDNRKEVKPDVMHDLTKKWPWETDSVDAIRCGFFFHTITPEERIFFMNELYRVLKPNHPFKQDGPRAEIITPHWASTGAYLHPYATAVSEATYLIYNKKWRQENDYEYVGNIKTNFKIVSGYGAINQDYVGRNQEYFSRALGHDINVAGELWTNVFKLPKDVLE